MFFWIIFSSDSPSVNWWSRQTRHFLFIFIIFKTVWWWWYGLFWHVITGCTFDIFSCLRDVFHANFINLYFTVSLHLCFLHNVIIILIVWFWWYSLSSSIILTIPTVSGSNNQNYILWIIWLILTFSGQNLPVLLLLDTFYIWIAPTVECLF